jgi:hypothetical protein
VLSRVPMSGISERRSALTCCMTSGMRARGTGQAVLTGSILVPLGVSHRTVVVITRRGAIISCRAKDSPFGHRAPLTASPSVSRSQQAGQTMQVYRFALSLFRGFCSFLRLVFFSEDFSIIENSKSVLRGTRPLTLPSPSSEGKRGRLGCGTVSKRSSQLFSVFGYPVDQIMHIVRIPCNMNSVSRLNPRIDEEISFRDQTY